MKKVILMMSVLLSAGWFCAFRILRSTPISTIATILNALVDFEIAPQQNYGYQ